MFSSVIFGLLYRFLMALSAKDMRLLFVNAVCTSEGVWVAIPVRLSAHSCTCNQQVFVLQNAHPEFVNDLDFKV